MQTEYKRVRNRSFRDLTGLKFGQLTVIRRAQDYVNPHGDPYIQWECRCSCGKICVKRGTALTSGKAISCGCARKTSLRGKNVKDLTGQRFGRWTVIRRAGSRPDRVATWECKCDCGTVAIVSGASLRRGDSTSCGCLKIEHLTKDRDLIGQKFGRLIVVGRAGDLQKYGRRNKMWRCSCECGNVCDVREPDLLSGSVQSCGCVAVSLNELYFSQLLAERGIKYQPQVTFTDLVGIGGRELRYDFGLYLNCFVLVELQGKQHYASVEYFGGDALLEQQQTYDHMKKDYAKEHGIKLFTIDCSERPSKKQLAEMLDHLLEDCGYACMTNLVPPAEEFELMPASLPRFSGSRRSLSAYARYYQFPVFYARELRLWHENPMYKGMPLREFLLKNRAKYLDKKQADITDTEILRGFTISGIMKGFTVFDAKLMQNVIDDFGIGSVYDPCAGWGERMLCCYHNKLPYFGIDINESLAPGYTRMTEDFHMEYQTFMVGDAAVFKPTHKYDAVITCPPYGNIEKYSEKGSENLSRVEYLKWWADVVGNCSDFCRYFCFQINQKYKDDLCDIVKKAGFVFRKEYVYGYAKSSHFMKSSGTDIKKEHESMVVFERVFS